jgi:hypothetical protein
MRDELREKIASLIKGHTISMWRGLTSPEELSDQILALIAPELAKANKYDELYSAASDVMRCLDTFGAKIVPHLMDTDDNPGQRLRDALNQPDEVSQ